MPYKNEHAARQLDPKRFKVFRRVHKKFPPGVDVVFGVERIGRKKRAKIQSVRFQADQWTPKSAKRWLEAHNMKARVVKAKRKR